MLGAVERKTQALEVVERTADTMRDRALRAEKEGRQSRSQDEGTRVGAPFDGPSIGGSLDQHLGYD